VLQAVRQATGAESGVFVEDGLMARIATLVPRPDEERIVGGYRNVEATDWPVLRPLISPGLLAKADDVNYRWLSVEGVAYGVAVVPLQDFKGQRIGAVVIVRSFELYQRQVWMALVKSLAIAALQAGLLVGALGVAINGLLMRPIGRLGGMLERLAAGDGGVEVGELGKRRDEVGRMARALETLQASLRPRGARPDGEP
jgi:methyl-accepting chemotaxis protein